MSKHCPGEILFSQDEIRVRVEELAGEIEKACHGRPVVILALLRGSFMFLADLARSLFVCGVKPCIEFVRASSYGAGIESSGKVVIADDFEMDLAGKSVLIVDDILDTGRTMSRVVEVVRGKGAGEVMTCVLLDKPSRREVQVKADFTGFPVENIFVVGYGLDYNDEYRYLPHICTLEIG